MSAYPEVPALLYGALALVAIVFAIVPVEVVVTKLPTWALAIAIIVAALFLLPIGIIMVITKQTIALLSSSSATCSQAVRSR